MRDTTVRGLRTFCAAARHPSFKAAANELYITPSAVSHQIKTLEEQLGVALFVRLARGVELTEAGRTLFQRVDPKLIELDAIAADFKANANSRRSLKLTVLPFFASEIFMPVLRRFTEAHESIDIRIETTEAGARHSSGSDASILLLSSPPDDCCAHALLPLKLVPACAPSLLAGRKPGRLESLGGAPLIVHKSRPGAWSDWFALAGTKMPDRSNILYLDSMFAVARAAERGLGIALVPVPLSDAWFASGALTRVFDLELATNDRYFFVYRREDAVSADVCALRDWLIDTFVDAEKNSSVA